MDPLARRTGQGEAERIKAEFASRRRRQLLVTIPVLGIFALVATVDESTGKALGGIPAGALVPLVFVLIIGLVVFAFTNWRCPGCNKYLGKAFSPRFCSKCGVALQ